MIVQCDQCNAKFRLDDSKIKEGGAKVRCSKCKHIFVVQKEPAEETDFDSLLSGLVPPPSEVSQTSAEAPAPGMELPPAPEVPADAAIRETREESGGFTGKEEFDFGEFTFEAEPAATPEAAPPMAEEAGGGDFGEVDLGGGETTGKEAEVPGHTGQAMPSFDEAAFSFEEEQAPPVPEVEIRVEGFDEPGAPTGGFDAGAASPPERGAGFSPVPPMEFTFEPESAAPPNKLAPEEKAGGAASFDLGEFEFGGSAPAEQPAPAPFAFETAAAQSEPEEKPAEAAPFDFGEFEFGAPAEKPEPAAVGGQGGEEWAWEKEAPHVQEETPLYEPISAPHIPEMPMVEEEELPPLSIASRRRGSSILPIAVIAVCVALVIALAGGGFYLFKEGPEAFNKVGLGFMAKWLGMETKEEGGIAVRNPVGTFLNNKEAGEIFVVNGEAVNGFTKPRASIQVKALLYGVKGEVLLQKVAYCGNALSKEQLTTMPVAKMEAAMANQFGDSLSNLAVQPGKAIPFVVVFTNVPKGATDFGVEVAGSTVASQ